MEVLKRFWYARIWKDIQNYGAEVVKMDNDAKEGVQVTEQALSFATIDLPSKKNEWWKNARKVVREKLWLNDYGDVLDRLRIERGPGGMRCLWRAVASMRQMEDTRKFLQRTWKLKKS